MKRKNGAGYNDDNNKMRWCFERDWEITRKRNTKYAKAYQTFIRRKFIFSFSFYMRGEEGRDVREKISKIHSSTRWLYNCAKFIVENIIYVKFVYQIYYFIFINKYKIIKIHYLIYSIIFKIFFFVKCLSFTLAVSYW